MEQEITAIIRQASAGDAKPIRRMIFEVLCDYGVPADPDGSDADVMDFGKPKEPGVVHLVAEVDGQPVGSAILTPYDEHRVKLSKLFLHPKYRNHGLGRRLLSTAVEEARRAGYAEIFLTTRGVYREAVRLYESSGWQRGSDQPPPGPDRLYYLGLGDAAEGPGSAAADLARSATGRADR